MRIFFLIPFICSPVCQYSFSQDSERVEKPITFFVNEKSYDRGNYSVPDTSLGSYHYFLPGFYSNYKTLGNSGSPCQSLYFTNSKITGFNTGIEFMNVYAFQKEQINYFNTRRPFSKVFFQMGSKEEQIVNVKHSQNIVKQLNVGLEYTNITSTGFYQRQKTRGNNFQMHSNFESANRFYGFFANFIYHKSLVEENGGLFNPFLFEEGSETRKDAMETELTNAFNLYKKKSWYLKQFLNFGKKEDFFDKGDSITRKRISPGFRLAHTFSFEKQIYSFRDELPDSTKYIHLFNYDRTRNPVDSIKDSLNVKIYENTVSLSTVDFTGLSGSHSGFKNFFSNVYLKNQNVSRLTHNNNFDTSFHNFMAGAELNLRFFNFFSAGGSAVEVIEGYNKGDHYYQGFFQYSPGARMDTLPLAYGQKPKHQLRFETFHQIKHPDWIFTRYFSDQLQWQYDFLNSSFSGQSLSYLNENWKINIGFSQNYYKNPVYFSSGNTYRDDTVLVATGIIPQQRKERITVNQVYLRKHFEVWKFHLKTGIYYQETSNEVILPLPEFTTVNSLYFESLMLRKAVVGQIGFDFNYHTGYYGNAYSPFLKQFYLQSDKMVGDYPFFDFFVNFKIKSVRAFFKMTHVNSGFSGNTYYLVPDYPQPDRAFRFGIDWRFLD